MKYVHRWFGDIESISNLVQKEILFAYFEREIQVWGFLDFQHLLIRESRLPKVDLT